MPENRNCCCSHEFELNKQLSDNRNFSENDAMKMKDGQFSLNLGSINFCANEIQDDFTIICTQNDCRIVAHQL